MTTGKLIDYLSKFPRTTNVYIDGYEGGVEDLEIIQVGAIALNINSMACLGTHEQISSVEEETRYRKNGATIQTGIILKTQSN